LHIPAWLSIDYRSAVQAAEAAGSADPSIVLAHQAWLTHPTLLGIPVIFNALAVSIVALITWLLIVGVKESARVNNVMVVVKLLILGFFVYSGVQYVKPENWSPFMPNGFSGVWVGASLIFFAYIGFDAISTAAEECKKPSRDLPIGIIGSLVICTLIYVAVALVLTGMVPWNHLGVADPLAAAAQVDIRIAKLDVVVGLGRELLVVQHQGAAEPVGLETATVEEGQVRTGIVVQPPFGQPEVADDGAEREVEDRPDDPVLRQREIPANATGGGKGIPLHGHEPVAAAVAGQEDRVVARPGGVAFEVQR
jgi:hypothetical protein